MWNKVSFLVGDINTRHFNTRPQRTNHDHYLSLLLSLVSFLPRSPYRHGTKKIEKVKEGCLVERTWSINKERPPQN